MPVDNSLLEILVCPESHQPLSVLDDERLVAINKQIVTEGITNISGEEVNRPLQEALIRQDNSLIYPIEDNIPILLAEKAIKLL